MKPKLLLLSSLLFLFTSCVTGPTITPGSVIAVWDFEDLTYENTVFPDLGSLLTAKAIEHIKNKGTYSVVERQELAIILTEQQISSSEITNEATRLKLGRLAGARLMVFGAYQVIGDRIRLDLRLVDVETGSILNAKDQLFSKTNQREWMQAAEVVMDLF